MQPLTHTHTQTDRMTFIPDIRASERVYSIYNLHVFNNPVFFKVLCLRSCVLEPSSSHPQCRRRRQELARRLKTGRSERNRSEPTESTSTSRSIRATRPWYDLLLNILIRTRHVLTYLITGYDSQSPLHVAVMDSVL